MQIFMNAM